MDGALQSDRLSARLVGMPGRRPFVPTESEKRLAAALRSAREHKRLTQAEVARKIGVVARTFKRYENAERAIPAGTVIRLQEILGPMAWGPSGAWTVAGGVAEPPAVYGEIENLASNELLLLRTYRRLSAAKRMELLGYAVSLADMQPPSTSVPTGARVDEK